MCHTHHEAAAESIWIRMGQTTVYIYVLKWCCFSYFMLKYSAKGPGHLEECHIGSLDWWQHVNWVGWARNSRYMEVLVWHMFSIWLEVNPIKTQGPSSMCVKFLGIQWSEACLNISFKRWLLYLLPPSKSSTVLCRFLWVLEVAYTVFGYTSLIHLWGIRRVDNF